MRRRPHYVLLGAVGHAMAAFALSRFVGYETVHRWFGGRLSVGLIGSKNALTGIVFASRLPPFLKLSRDRRSRRQVARDAQSE